MRVAFSPKWISCLALAIGLATGAYCSASAEGLFNMDIVEWKSFEGYEDGQTRRPPPAPPKEETPAQTPAQTKQRAAEIPKEVEFPNANFRTPPMPGMNKGFNVEVKSTEEEKEEPPIPNNEAKGEDIFPSDKNWKPVVPAKAADSSDDNEENAPLNVRMTYLPSKAVPVTKNEKESAAKKGHDLMRRLAEQKRKAPVPKTPEEKEACKAMDVYKKQQLDALHSDRETLKALQEAIRSLGLTKQLEFMTEQGSALSSPQVSVAIPAGDAPASRVK